MIVLASKNKHLPIKYVKCNLNIKHIYENKLLMIFNHSKINFTVVDRGKLILQALYYIGHIIQLHIYGHVYIHMVLL